MKVMRRALPVLIGALALMAAACTPPDGGGTGPANVAPIAVATGTPVSGNAPLATVVDGSGSTDPDGSIVSYSWNFGNGTTGTGPASSVVFSTPGVFTVTLTVTDDKGATGTDSFTVTANGDGDGDGYFVPADCNDSDPTIHPGADDPAGDNIDQNCDGIDGVQNDAVFVNSGTGADTGSCGSITQPCASINQGQFRAVDTGRGSVFVAGGTYAKFNVVAGLEVRGGYGQNWQRGVTATSPVTATVNAAQDADLGGPVAIRAEGINTPTTVADLRVQGAAANTGQSSYGIFVRNSTNALVLDSLNVVAGSGGQGADGAAGQAGWLAAASVGLGGQNGFEPGGCNTSAAGEGGNGGSGANNGGKGGKGGVIDGNCVIGICTSCDARPGNVGVTGAGFGGGSGGGGGNAGTSGIPGVCNIQGNRATDGYNGLGGASGAPGAAGAGGAAGLPGGDGGIGAAGAGGGGGGGGGGADCGVDDAGAGGGGGGAGGHAATQGGRGGAAGAASIGIRLVNSSPQLASVQISLGTGGKGGNGGAGAPGQPGGAGGSGGASFERGGKGGNGGVGGTGGTSGVGGGGGGGAAIGLSRTANSTPGGTWNATGGTGGQGGTGGNTGAAGQVLNLHVG